MRFGYQYFLHFNKNGIEFSLTLIPREDFNSEEIVVGVNVSIQHPQRKIKSIFNDSEMIMIVNKSDFFNLLKDQK